MEKYEFENLSVRLFNKFPEVEKNFLEQKDFYEEMINLPHIIFGDLLNPIIINLLTNDTDDKYNKRLVEIFDFLEELANSEDKKIIEVVQMTVLERIGDDKQLLTKSFKYMGKQTSKLCQDIEKFWNRV